MGHQSPHYLKLKGKTYYFFNSKRPLSKTQHFKHNRDTALTDWRSLVTI